MLVFNLEVILFLVCVGGFTAAAAVWDLRTRRIPNKLTLPVFVLGLIYRGVFDGFAGLGDAGLAFAVGFGTLFVLWIVGGGGGGDVKLMGALSVWLGFRMTLYVLIVSTVFVLLGTLGVMAWSMLARGPMATRKRFLATGKPKKVNQKPKKETVAEKQKRRVMAYAIPVALATWLVVLWKLPTISEVDQKVVQTEQRMEP